MLLEFVESQCQFLSALSLGTCPLGVSSHSPRTGSKMEGLECIKLSSKCRWLD